MNWAVCRLVWESRGYKFEAISAMLQEKYPGRKGLSVSSLQRSTRDAEEAPPDLVEDILALSVQPAFEEQAEIVRLGLEALKQHPHLDPEGLAANLQAKLQTVDPEVIATAIASKVVGSDELAKKVAAEVVTRLAQQPNPLGADELVAKVLAAVPRPARVDEEALKAGIASSVARAQRPYLLALGGVVVVGILVVVGVELGRVAPGWAAAMTPGLVVNISSGEQGSTLAVEYGYDLLTGRVSATSELGEKAARPVPKQPLRGQKLPPCDAGLREVAINGGCWVGPFAPPCGRLHEYENQCYRAVAADPKEPVSEKPEEKKP